MSAVLSASLVAVASHILQERSPNLVSSSRSGFPKIWTIQEVIEDIHDVSEWPNSLKQSLECNVPAGPRLVAVNLVNRLFDLDVGIFRKRLGTRPAETIYMFYKNWYMFAWNKFTRRFVCLIQTIYAHVHSIYKFQSWCIWPWAEAIIASDYTTLGWTYISCFTPNVLIQARLCAGSSIA